VLEVAPAPPPAGLCCSLYFLLEISWSLLPTFLSLLASCTALGIGLDWFMVFLAKALLLRILMDFLSTLFASEVLY